MKHNFNKALKQVYWVRVSNGKLVAGMYVRANSETEAKKYAKKKVVKQFKKKLIVVASETFPGKHVHIHEV